MPRAKRGRGNPNWGKFQPCPVIRTEFEAQVERLGLARAEYLTSRELRRWCERHRNQYYIPEWLLKEWGMSVDSIFSGVA